MANNLVSLSELHRINLEGVLSRAGESFANDADASLGVTIAAMLGLEGMSENCASCRRQVLGFLRIQVGESHNLTEVEAMELQAIINKQ